MPSLSNVAAVVAARVSSHRPIKREPRTILAIEDSLDTLVALTIILEAVGYRVVGARDGLEGLRNFERERFDLVILDLDLPTVSGFRLMQLLREAKPATTVPIIVFTAYDYEEAMDVVQAGAADLITKPFDARDLLEKVAFALRRASLGSWLPPLRN